MKKILLLLIACSACSGNLSPRDSSHPKAPKPTTEIQQCHLTTADKQKLVGTFSFPQLMLRLQEVTRSACELNFTQEALEEVLDQSLHISCDAEECHLQEK